MDELLMRLRSALAAETLVRIKQYGPRYNSDHEAWGLALEELVEAGREWDALKKSHQEYLMLCMLKLEERADISVQDVLQRCQDNALRTAAELIQYAVVCEKAKDRSCHKF